MRETDGFEILNALLDNQTLSAVLSSHDESAGVQNAAIMWAVVPPGGSISGSWLLVVRPGGRTCSILSEYMALVQIYLGLRFIFTASRSLERMTNKL